MPRVSGSQNHDFDQKRQELLQNIRDRLFSDAPPSSYRGLAEAAGVTISTLRHYFGNREQVFAAIFADCHAHSDRELLTATTPPKRLSNFIQ
ncbi:MAG: TetR/AcrR family transcriptional regulator [Nodosilinea sp.]